MKNRKRLLNKNKRANKRLKNLFINSKWCQTVTLINSYSFLKVNLPKVSCNQVSWDNKKWCSFNNKCKIWWWLSNNRCNNNQFRGKYRCNRYLLMLRHQVRLFSKRHSRFNSLKLRRLYNQGKIKLMAVGRNRFQHRFLNRIKVSHNLNLKLLLLLRFWSL